MDIKFISFPIKALRKDFENVLSSSVLNLRIKQNKLFEKYSAILKTKQIV